MRTAIIAAMEEEVKYLVEHIDKYEIYEFQGYEYHIGEIEEKKVVVCRSGIGKVNAALSTALLLEHFNVKHVINTGSAGAIDQNFSVGDIILADKCLYHDVDAVAFGYKYGQVPGMPEYYKSSEEMLRDFELILKDFQFKYFVGTIATGDSFMTEAAKFHELADKLGVVLAVDMEATAITQVCNQYQIPYIIVRSISDVVNKASNIDFDAYIDLAARNSTEVIISYLNKQ